jgi:hypothetical protein
MRRVLFVCAGILAMAGATAAVAFATLGSDTRVSAGSPVTPFSQNKQNEPALAVDQSHPNILVAGANDNIDMEACSAGDPTTCPFTPGVGASGVYFSFDSGATWTQPTYTGWTARNCLGPAACAPQVGPIGTVPGYFEQGLLSDGDPGVAFGPRRGANGSFSWANGSRLYYSNLTANFGATRADQSFKGQEAIAVSRTDDVHAAAAGDARAWQAPVLVSRQSSTTFSDKSQIWADNAASSPFFGNVYVCWASFRGLGNAAPAPLNIAVSSDGGDTWRQRQVTAAADNAQRAPADGCTIRTDSRGVAYAFGVGTVTSAGKQPFELMFRSTNGGSSWSKATPVAGPVSQPGVIDPVTERPVIDGIAGARSDLAPAPSVDIANGAPTGADATNRIVMSYVSGDLAHAHVEFTESTDLGATWSAPRAIETAGDRGIYAAPAISPDGTDVYVTYNAFTTPYRTNTSDPRNLVGVVEHADSGAAGTPTGAFSELHRGANGDPRASSQNDLMAEFLGDYVYSVATRDYGAGVWNDTRNAADCPAIDAYRAALEAGNAAATAPAPQTACPATWGNSDIFGGSYADPTP